MKIIGLNLVLLFQTDSITKEKKLHLTNVRYLLFYIKCHHHLSHNDKEVPLCRAVQSNRRQIGTQLLLVVAVTRLHSMWGLRFFPPLCLMSLVMFPPWHAGGGWMKHPSLLLHRYHHFLQFSHIMLVWRDRCLPRNITVTSEGTYQCHFQYMKKCVIQYIHSTEVK